GISLDRPSKYIPAPTGISIGAMSENDRSAPAETPAETSSGIPLRAVFDRGDVRADWSPPAPGVPPFTRGANAGGYRTKLWTMRQYAGFSTAKASNERYRFLLAQGQTGLSVAFDLPTQIGFDSDHALARGEVGKVGVAIDTLEDMEILLDSLPFETVSI